jgi:3-deoxy-7-phosphoheptulonate synthase
MFLSPDKHGQMTIYQTSGNPYGHIIMRGGKQPNYHAADIAAACDSLHEFDLPEQLVIDFSHGNCQKQHRRQLEVCEDVCNQIRNGSRAIAGVMAESFIREGTQKIVAGQPLVYGQSITDPCLNWEDTETLLDMLADATDSRF